MQFALIPPTSLLGYTQFSHMQLVLPHLFNNDKNYARHYRKLSICGHYVILDNGAAENQQVDSQALLNLNHEIWADEIAIPDCLGDAEKTFDYFEQFFKANLRQIVQEKTFITNIVKSYKLGFVAQGSNYREVYSLVETVMNSHYAELVSVVYIPRLLVTQEHLYTRLDLAQFIHNKYPHLEIHLFGMPKMFLGEIPLIRKIPFIRSFDTSAPFNWAFANMELQSHWTAISISRPDDYFYRRPDKAEQYLITRNIDIMMDWIDK